MPSATTPRATTRPPRNSVDEATTLARIGERAAAARREAGLTLAGVAQRSGLSPAYLSQIESGAANPTLRALVQLATAVDADLAQLVGAAAGSATEQTFPTYYARAARALQSPGAQGIWDRSADGDRRLRTRVLYADAGDHAVPVQHPGEEYLLVLRGSCRLHVGSDVRTLHAGDSCHFAAGQPHHLGALTADLTLSVVMSEPSG